MKSIPRVSPTFNRVELSLAKVLAKLAMPVLLCSMACNQALADGELKNGDFVETWRMRDNADEQLIPKHWFASEPETTGSPWVKVLEEDPTGVEIKAGESSRYLFQDVRVDGTQPWTLKWKCKGTGGALVTVIPRDDSNTLFPGTSKSCPLVDVAEEHEMPITMPATATILRIMLAPREVDSTVVFQNVELSSASN